MAHKHKPHAIMIPIPHQGHITPFINLALRLASKGFAITFVNFEFVHQMMAKPHHGKISHDVDLFFEARKSGLNIRYRTISDGLPLEFDRGVHLVEFWEIMFQNFPALIDKFIGKIIETDPSLIHFLVADTFYSWSYEIAEKYNLVHVSFWTEPALVFSLIYHSELMREKGHFPCKDSIAEEINYIPGIESISTKDFMPYLKQSQATSVVHEIILASFKGIKKIDFILHNTVQELEFEILSALNKHQRNYAIGPVNFSKYPATITVSKSLWFESDCTNWLDSKPPGSVLYVSFGSLVHVNKQIIEEIAYGLFLSEVNFIWVVRPGASGSADHEVLPDGFEHDVNDKGLIISWCDQIKVLPHPTVKGFLTHCGWNSVLESTWFGKPMICYPIDFDQLTNRKLVVDDLKIGINLCDGNSVTREEVAKKIKKFMSEPDSLGFDRDIIKVRDKLHNAVGIDGSSERNFNQFVEDLNAKIDATTKTA